MNVTKNKIIFSVNADRKVPTIEAIIKLIEELKPLAVMIQDLPNNCRGDKLNDLLNKRTKLNYQLVDSTHCRNEETNTSRQIGLENAILVHHSVYVNKIILPRSSITANTIIIGTSLRIPNENKFQLYNIYIKPRATYKETQSVLDILRTSAQSIKSRCVIMGDFNAISPEWAKMENIFNCSHYNSLSQKHYKQIYLNRGRSISNLMRELKLTCLNETEEGPTFVSHQHKNSGSYIDLALVGTKARRIWNKFTIRIVSQHSEHRAIIIHPSKIGQLSLQNLSHYVYPINRINARHFEALKIETNSLCNRWEKFSHDKTIEIMNQITELTYKCLLEVQLNIRIPRYKNPEILDQCSSTKKLTLLTKKLRQYQTKLKRLRRQSTAAKPLKRPRNSTERRFSLKIKTLRMIPIIRGRIKNLVNKSMNLKELRQKIKESTHIPIETTENIWDIMRKSAQYLKETSNSKSKLVSRDQIINQEQLNHVVKDKFPHSTNREYSDELKNCPENEINWPTILNDSEIEFAIKKLRHKKYCDINGVQFKVFNRACRFIPNIMHTICRMSFFTATTPSICQTTRGIMIPKKEPGKYRIVHISTPLASLLEEIALHRLEYRLELNKLNSNYQFGFRPLRGRHELITRIIELTMKYRAGELATSSKEPTTTIISFDIEGAFDNVNQQLLVRKLLGDLESDSLKYWLANFILNRYIILEHNSMRSVKTKIHTGVPQGSSLGPILWNYMINNIGSNITIPTKLELLAYADDLYLVYNGYDTQLVQDKIDLLVYKLIQMRLKINPEKCSSIALTRKKGITSTLKYTIYNRLIRTVEKLKILGVTFNKNLELDQESQMETIMSNVSKLHRINQLGIINISTNWHTLINSYLTSLIIINNIPILATDKKARRWADKLMTRCLKTIFRWPNNVADKLTRLITKTYSTHLVIESYIRRKQLSEHNEGYKLLEKLLGEADQKEYGKISNLSEYNPYNKRKHHDPRLALREPQLVKLNSHNIRPVWIVSDRDEGSLLVEILDRTILQIRGAYHAEYPIQYFNMMAAIWETVNNDSITTRDILVNRNNPLVKALYNYSSHDWRIIQLRECLIQKQWKILYTDDRTFKRYKWLSTTVEPINIKITNTPWLKDYRWNNLNESRTESSKSSEMEMNQTRITYYLGRHQIWHTISPNELNSKHMLALTGLLMDTDGKLIKGDLENREQQPHGCERNECRTNIMSTTLHRMMECTRYETLRIEMIDRDSTRETIREWFKINRLRKKILKLLTETTL